MHNFVQNILKIYGKQGQIWLRQLPTIILQLTKNWQLRNLTLIDNLTYNYVAYGYQQDNAIILKISPDSSALEREIKALQAFQNFGAIKSFLITKEILCYYKKPILVLV